LIDAARMADSFAERQAEEARERDEAWQAGSRFAELGEEIKEVRREALRLIAEFKANREAFMPAGSAIRAAVCTRIEELRNAIRDARQQRAELIDVGGYALAHEYGEAFNDGAGSAIIS
jgi:predicted  nucleic acid-binding Zn-ribbon protein